MGCKYYFKLSGKYEHRQWHGHKQETCLSVDGIISSTCELNFAFENYQYGSDRYGMHICIWWCIETFQTIFKKKTLVFRAFTQNPKLCPIFKLIEYLDIRLSRSSDTALFLSTFSLYKGASSDTIR